MLSKVVSNIINRQSQHIDGIFISGCKSYLRSKTSLREVPIDIPSVHYHTDCKDEGPGTKLLCALEKLNSTNFNVSNTIFVIFDDDRIYHDWTIDSLLSCIESDTACSHYTFPINKNLIIGQGADMFGFHLKTSEKLRSYFDCVRARSQEYIMHDDFIFSTYLQFVEHQKIVRASYKKPYTPIRDKNVTSVGLVNRPGKTELYKTTIRNIEKDFRTCSKLVA